MSREALRRDIAAAEMESILFRHTQPGGDIDLKAAEPAIAHATDLLFEIGLTEEGLAAAFHDALIAIAEPIQEDPFASLTRDFDGQERH